MKEDKKQTKNVVVIANWVTTVTGTKAEDVLVSISHFPPVELV